MVTLTEFIGEVLDNVSKARSYSDYASAALSEQYFADPFIKNLPIPHYTIDEAEIEVPVIVVGIKTDSEQFEAQKSAITDIAAQKLPALLLHTFKTNFDIENEIKKQKKQQENKATILLGAEAETNTVTVESNEDTAEMPDSVLDYFISLAEELSVKMVKKVKKNLNNYNYQLIKLLDLTDDFNKDLLKILSKKIASFPNEAMPQSKDAYLKKCVDAISGKMFFEFKKIMQTDGGVQVDVSTTQMNEFSAKFDCLMHIKLKIREQDLNLLTENKDNKEKRFLSLT